MSDWFYVAAATVAFTIVFSLGFSSSKSIWPWRLLILAVGLSTPIGLYLAICLIPICQEWVADTGIDFAVGAILGNIAFCTAPFAVVLWPYVLARLLRYATSAVRWR